MDNLCHVKCLKCKGKCKENGTLPIFFFHFTFFFSYHLREFAYSTAVLLGFFIFAVFLQKRKLRFHKVKLVFNHLVTE